jgi:hypothetical protein
MNMVCGKPFGDKLSLYEHYDSHPQPSWVITRKANWCSGNVLNF